MDEIELLEPLIHTGGSPPDAFHGISTEALISTPRKKNWDLGSYKAEGLDDGSGAEAQRCADVQMAEAGDESQDEAVTKTPHWCLMTG